MLIIAAIVFQFFVLTGMYVKAAMPLWTGEEVRVKTVPVDPRSLFRGNYARLDYDISMIETQHFPENNDLRNGEIVYVQLKQDSSGLYVYSSVALERPESGVFLRGRIENRRYEDHADYFRVKYGIEALFAPKEKALALEHQLRSEAVAVLMVLDGGEARLKEVVSDKPPAGQGS